MKNYRNNFPSLGNQKMNSNNMKSYKNNKKNLGF